MPRLLYAMVFKPYTMVLGGFFSLSGGTFARVVRKFFVTLAKVSTILWFAMLFVRYKAFSIRSAAGPSKGGCRF